MNPIQRTGSPAIAAMQVIPVAGHDSMLLNLCGAHAPYSAHERYKRVASGARDDAMAMRYLVPDWTYDPKRSSMVR